eukprot:1797545-Alexandrium_andersonii.AAC.1
MGGLSSSSVGQLHALVKYAETRASQLANEDLRSARESFASWAKASLERGGGIAHRWTAKGSALPSLPQEGSMAGGVATRPLEMMDLRA